MLGVTGNQVLSNLAKIGREHRDDLRLPPTELRELRLKPWISPAGEISLEKRRGFSGYRKAADPLHNSESVTNIMIQALERGINPTDSRGKLIDFDWESIQNAIRLLEGTHKASRSAPGGILFRLRKVIERAKPHLLKKYDRTGRPIDPRSGRPIMVRMKRGFSNLRLVGGSSLSGRATRGAEGERPVSPPLTSRAATTMFSVEEGDDDDEFADFGPMCATAASPYKARITTPPSFNIPSEITGEVLEGPFPTDSAQVLTFEKDLGEGSFGSVKKYRAEEGTCYAVKSFNCSSILEEASSGLSLKDNKGEVSALLAGNEHSNIAETKAILLYNKNTKQYMWVNAEEQLPTDNLEHYVIELVVSEYIEGKSLEKAIKDLDVGQTPDSATSIGLQVSRAFVYLKSKGILHRDLKTLNLMYSNGKVSLIDFGLGKKIPEGGATRTMVGSPPYLAPEVLRGRSYSYAVDAWQLGMLIAEIASDKGNPPSFYKPNGEESDNTLDNIRSYAKLSDEEKVNFLRIHMGINNKDLCRIIAGLTRGDPEARLTVEDAEARLSDLDARLSPEPSM